MIASRDIVAANVERIRKRRNLSQQELAQKAGVRQPMVSKIERAKHDPQCETLDRLAEALDVSAAELLTPPRKKS